ncbi:LacI family DNA-binding transcriptional regulator [Salipaludibacillus sp. HK11]|uniref:LacI family DNA-binding transcriptional regulator n=1 Tax=Salipaludibacillus sp. HK11 TaxID=3394320 RepID=UPI0039FC596E
MARKKVTMEQIANSAGVSKYVVSKTLNGKPGVSEKTRKKILYIAQQLGYDNFTIEYENKRPSQATKETQFMLCVIPNRQYQDEAMYWAKVLEGISQGSDENDIGLVIVTEKQPYREMVNVESIYGIIGVGKLSEEVLINLKQLAVPMVLVDHDDPLISVDCIFKDNFEGVNKLTKHLITLEHKHFAFVGDLNHSQSFYDRWLGFRTAIEQHGNLMLKEPLSFSYSDSMKEEIHQWIKNEGEKSSEHFPTAFVCANDDIASVLMSELKAFGYQVPEDCSVTGFDNVDFSLYTNPPLATIQVLKEAIGKRSVTKLIWRKNNPDAPKEKLLLRGEMIIRGSVDVSPDTKGEEKADGKTK